MENGNVILVYLISVFAALFSSTLGVPKIFLSLVLLLLSLLSEAFDLGGQAVSDQSVGRLELLASANSDW